MRFEKYHNASLKYIFLWHHSLQLSSLPWEVVVETKLFLKKVSDHFHSGAQKWGGGGVNVDAKLQ